MKANKPTMLAVHDEDPAEKIWKTIGKVDDIKLYANWVLVGIYERPNKMKSGLYLADQTIREDEHQGKAALVLSKGPSAFVSDGHYDFKGQNVEPGDWVMLFVTDGRKVKIRGQLCRMVEDVHIRAKILSPDVVY